MDCLLHLKLSVCNGCWPEMKNITLGSVTNEELTHLMPGNAVRNSWRVACGESEDLERACLKILSTPSVSTTASGYL